MTRNGRIVYSRVLEFTGGRIDRGILPLTIYNDSLQEALSVKGVTGILEKLVSQKMLEKRGGLYYLVNNLKLELDRAKLECSNYSYTLERLTSDMFNPNKDADIRLAIAKSMVESVQKLIDLEYEVQMLE